MASRFGGTLAPVTARPALIKKTTGAANRAGGTLSLANAGCVSHRVAEGITHFTAGEADARARSAGGVHPVPLWKFPERHVGPTARFPFAGMV